MGFHKRDDVRVLHASVGRQLNALGEAMGRYRNDRNPGRGAFEREFEPIVAALRALASEWQCCAYTDEKLSTLGWHVGAWCGIAETNGHSRDAHFRWALQAIDALSMPMTFSRVALAPDESDGG